MTEFTRLRGSSKFFLGLHAFNMLAYQAGHIIQVIVSKDDSKPVHIPAVLATFMKVCETEMLFTFLIHFFSIYACSFNPYAAIFGLVTILLPWAMVYAYHLPETAADGEEISQADLNQLKTKKKWAKTICKVVNVGLVLNMFFLIFGSEFYFDIAKDLEKY